MKHLSSPLLLQKLSSSLVMERAFAAEELGHRQERAAVAPLIELLGGIDSIYGEDLDAVGPALRALAQIGDASCTRAVLKVLRVTAGHVSFPSGESIPMQACRTLVALKARSALPALRALQLGRSGYLYRDLLARCIAELGGETESTFLFELLLHPHAFVQGAGASGLGKMQHLPAAPALEVLSQTRNTELRWAARCALVEMKAPGAEEALLAEMRHPQEDVPRRLLLAMILDSKLTQLAPALFELSGDPRWADSQPLMFDTLEVAAALGSSPALDRCRATYGDRQRSLCVRARAAAILLGNGQMDVLPFCLEALRASAEAMRDPRDSARRRNETQREVIDALERFGREHREQRDRIAECLYELACCDLETDEDDSELDELDCYIPDRASHALYALTGVRGEGALLKLKIRKVAAI